MPVTSCLRAPRAGAKIIRLRVGRAQERVLASGNPWLFEGGIVSQSGDGPPGTLGVVYDRRNRLLAVGLYDPGSPIRLRVLELRRSAAVDGAWWRERVVRSLRKRDSIATPDTTGYRLIHGESDGIPAVVADRYGETLVLKVYSAALLPHLDAIVEALVAEFPAERVVLRLSRLMQRDSGTPAAYADGVTLAGSPPDRPVEFLESGLRFEADVLRGQKTGFFLDQRENRKRVGELASGRSVLNVFSYTGGFSAHSAAGGAVSVASLDLNKHALEGARRNFALNPRLSDCPHELLQGDAFGLLERFGLESRRFDMAIVDPPSFARNKSQREDALQAYRRLASLAARVVNPGGILVSCSCSSHVSPAEFEAAVEAGLGSSSWQLFERRGHPVDHPVGFPEARYLKALYHRRAR